jgi:crossover junction endodeoxyribonuclease RusA
VDLVLAHIKEFMIELTLPFPPSVNTYWRTFQGRMLISKKGREYRKAVADEIILQKGNKHLKGKIKMTIEAWRPDNRRRDLDNLLKAPLDALTHAGVYEDDELIVDLRIFWAEDQAGKLKVKIEEIE